eukprot:CAMPEP_0175142590 /NCGR_PEP_ID=MMETSP0087-20121206/12901_1 /TAXON_ID=136419 /ORGANISM="Unknown Unknown, Strain D1" /LENGTH=294 /DNA_ID=CAMNT_0016426445 /DNA_START=61 /DNA_END=942 /DNA_ORIENTATION=+
MADGKVLCLRFNQTHSCLAVGSTDDFRIYSCLSFKKSFQLEEGGYGIVQMLFETSLVALVGAPGANSSLSSRTLKLYNMTTKKVLCELMFLSSILDVQLNRARLVVVLRVKIHVFDVKTMKLLHKVDTPPNPNGICALSPSEKHCFLAFPASQERGEVLIYDALNLQAVSMVHAHNGPIRYLSFNSTGTLLATASESGRLVRVHSLPAGHNLYQFKRGMHAADVNCIQFNPSSTLLCVCSSNSNTVHVFSLSAHSSSSSSDSSSSKPSHASHQAPSASTATGAATGKGGGGGGG